jgi:hypothetical protein
MPVRWLHELWHSAAGRKSSRLVGCYAEREASKPGTHALFDKQVDVFILILMMRRGGSRAAEKIEEEPRSRPGF